MQNISSCADVMRCLIPHNLTPHTSHSSHRYISAGEYQWRAPLYISGAAQTSPHFPTNISLKMRQWRCVCILLTFNCKSFLTLGDQVPSLMSYITPSLSHSKEFLLQTKKKNKKKKVPVCGSRQSKITFLICQLFPNWHHKLVLDRNLWFC